MSLQNIIKEGEKQADLVLAQACPFTIFKHYEDADFARIKAFISSRTTLAYKAGLERAREIVGEKKAYAEELEAISERFATKGAIAVCDDIFSALSQELTKEN